MCTILRKRLASPQTNSTVHEILLATYRVTQLIGVPVEGHPTDMASILSKPRPNKRIIGLITDSPVASVISDPRLPDNPIIACNTPFCELTGYPPEDVVGRNCRFLSGPGTEPWLSEEIRRGVREHKPVLVEILNYKRSGQPFRNAVLVAPIYDEADQLLYFLGSQVEIDVGAPTPTSMRRIRAAELVKSLSPRQGQILKLVASGRLNKQIAADLNVAEKTVKMHRAILMKRLSLNTSADLIRLAVEAGL
jgi:PAS domain S-box-containing protein